MNIPNLRQLLLASGYSIDDTQAVARTSLALYGYVGANLDERNWNEIMASTNPLQAAEAALRTMYSDQSYLLRNASQVSLKGYGAAQVEWTYRQLYKALGITYAAEWSAGTGYAYLAKMTDAEVQDRAEGEYQGSLPSPSYTFGYDATSAWATTSGGSASLSVSGSLGTFASGDTVLGQQSSFKEGYLTITNAYGKTSTSAEYLTLGTASGDSIDTSGAGSRKDFIVGGDGDDIINAGAGDDVVHGGAGNDTLTGGAGNDTLIGGAGNDRFNVDAGSDTIVDLSTGDVLVVSAGATATANNVSAFVATASTINSGVATLNAASTGANIDVSLAGGTAGFALAGSSGTDTLVGTALADTISGGGGNDTITGGGGLDVLSGGAGNDDFRFASGISTLAHTSTITDFRANGNMDTITLTGIVTVASNVNTVQDLSAQASLAAGLGVIANAATTNNGLSVFIWGGDTYVFVETTGSIITYQASDTVIKLTGLPFAAGTAIVGLGIDGA